MPMNSADYRESLRRCSPRVFVDGARVDNVVDAPALQPGINAIGLTYDFALREELAPVMRAVQASSGKTVNRMLHVDQSSADLLNKLEAVRLLCQETGCAQRYLAHDAFSALTQATRPHRCRQGNALRRALHRLPARLPGQGPERRHRHDRRQGRPQPSARTSRPTPTATSTSSSGTPRESSSRGPRRSSPARRTCTSSSSCRAAT